MSRRREPVRFMVGEWEVTAEAEAGTTLNDSQRWWGTRVEFRKPPARRWESIILVDVHPFDVDAITLALVGELARWGR